MPKYEVEIIKRTTSIATVTVTGISKESALKAANALDKGSLLYVDGVTEYDTKDPKEVE